MTKKAAIYDRWLHVLGGGERHTVALAQAVSKIGFDVEVMTHRPTDLKKLQNKFGLDKLSFKIKYIPELWDYQITPYTKDYDLFILNSFADIFKSQAKKSILSIFFPVSQKLTAKEYLTRAIVVPLFRSLFQFSLYEQHDSGLITIGRNKPEKEIAFKIFLPLLALSTVEQLSVSSIGTKVEISTRINHHKNIVEIKATANQPTKQWQLHYPISQYSEELTVDLKTNIFEKLANLLIKLVPFFGERMKAGPRKFSLSEIQSYDKILAISKYTAKWIKRYWGSNSEMIYPSIEIEKFSATKQKKNWIVSTGRFFVGGHNKKQLELVKSFKNIAKTIPGWELHLIGSVNNGKVHQKYFEKVKKEAQGYPIIIHENATFDELKELLSKSKIYWHASGLEISEEKYPVMIEHFGLTIIEAMASGCIPIVINKGGPAEVASKFGLTWNSLEKMEETTVDLINNKEKLNKLQKEVLKDIDIYNLKTFNSKIKKLIS